MELAREDVIELAGGDRGGVIQGYTPVHSHVQLYLVQIILIVVLCFLLGQVVKMWNQPRVIAEVRRFSDCPGYCAGVLVVTQRVLSCLI